MSGGRLEDLDLEARPPPATAWLDYLDARRRMVHEWHAQDIEAADIGVRLTVDVEQVEQIIGQLVDPPLPGSSRDRVATLQRRLAALESELHRLRNPPPAPPAATDRPPTDSDFRAILRGPGDPGGSC